MTETNTNPMRCGSKTRLGRTCRNKVRAVGVKCWLHSDSPSFLVAYLSELVAAAGVVVAVVSIQLSRSQGEAAEALQRELVEQQVNAAEALQRELAEKDTELQERALQLQASLAQQESAQQERSLQLQERLANLELIQQERIGRAQADEQLRLAMQALTQEDSFPDIVKVRNVPRKSKEEARFHLEQARRFASDYHRVETGWAIYWKFEGEWKQSEASYKAAIALDVNAVEAHEGLGGLLIDSGRCAEGLESLAVAMSLSRDPRYIVSYARGLEKCEGVASAITFLVEGEGAKRESPERFEYLGRLTSGSSLEQAIEWFRKAVAADPQYIPARTNLGHALRLQGDYAEARRVLLPVLRLDPKEAVAAFELGMIERNQGNNAEAERWLRDAVEWDPSHSNALYNLARILIDTGRPGEAEHYARRSNLVEASPRAQLLLADALEMQGKAEAAVAVLSDVVATTGYECAWLGDLWSRQGHLEEATKAFRKALLSGELSPAHADAVEAWLNEHATEEGTRPRQSGPG